MTVKAILEKKGREVFTIAPDSTLAEAIQRLAQRRVGALVVTNGGGSGGRIAGIISERDVVRALAEGGAAVLSQPVSSVMTTTVRRCRESHTVLEVMEIMTQGRFRHVPVEMDGELVGLVSIGDVVKRRISDAEREADEIRRYIATA